MSISSKDLQDQIYDLKFEPTRVCDLTFELLESALVDQQAFVADPSQPLPFLVENDVVLTAAAVEAYEAATMRLYPNMAMTEDDLYLHLSDADMIGMFALPGEAVFTLLLSKAEVIARAVAIDSSTSSKITIPKHTQVLVNNTVFTMQYPINIVIKASGGIEIMYDGTVKSDLQSLTDTNVNWTVVRLKSSVQGNLPNEYLKLDIPIKQMRLTSYQVQSNSTSILNKSFTFTDKFCYARAFRLLSDGSWSEINTTHSDHTFDPDDPTLLLKVVNNVLSIELPYVYQLTSLASATLRVDIYTTKGDLYTDLSGISSANFVISFKDLDNDDNGRYTAPLSLLETINILSTDALSGGSDAPTFAERRAAVLNNSTGPSSKPISPSQLNNTLETLGFDVVLNSDDVIGRTYQISRSMLAPTNGISSTPIDSAVMTVKTTVEGLLEFGTVVENEFRYAVLPSTLYKDVNGVLEIVSDEERITLETAGNDTKVNTLSNINYLYTPLHYILDIEDDRFEVRPYYLTNPTVGIAGYSASNETLDIFVQTSNDLYVTYDEDGYELNLLTESNSAYKALPDSQVHVQLAFKPDVESEWVYVNGTLVGVDDNGERYFTFRINTHWDIDSNHQLVLNNFTMRENSEQQHKTPLSGEWYLIWIASDYSIDGMTTSEVDDDIGTHLLSGELIGIYRESLQIRLGDELTGLWRRSRPIIGSIEYKTYDYDQPLLYSSNIYEMDETTNTPVVITDPVTGQKSLSILHAKGTQVYNAVTGDPEYLYRAGDAMRDEYGELIPLNSRTVMWWWDVVLFDANYRYATREADMDYAASVADVLTEWINDTLEPLKEMALERTEFSFHPRNSLKYVSALVNEGETVTLHTAQSLTVDLFLPQEAYNDSALRSVMSDTTLTVIADVLSQTQITREDFITSLKDSLGDDLITATISGLGGDEDYDVITLIDSTTRLCAAKILTVQSDGTLAVKDDITINFKRHSTTS